MQLTQDGARHPSSLSSEAFTRSLQLTISMPLVADPEVDSIKPEPTAASTIAVILGTIWAFGIEFTDPIPLVDGGVGFVFYTAGKPNIVEAYNDGEIIISLHSNTNVVTPYATEDTGAALTYILKAVRPA